jgi:integrase
MTITVREAIAGYEEHARSLSLADSYIRIQMSYLARFAGSCRDIQVKSLTPAHIARFYDSLPKTRASHNRALSALRGFVSYLERMRYLKAGSASFLLGDRKTQKFTRKPKYYIPPSQFGPMLDAAGERHPADRMTLALALYTLGRQGEIAGLRLKDVDCEAKTIRIYRGKRKRWTTVQICPELWTEFARWIYTYAGSQHYLDPRLMMEDHPDWYLVPGLDCIKGRSPTGEYDAKLTEYQLAPERPAVRLERLVKRMLDIFGAQTEDGKWVKHLGEGMHTIRRSGARAMIDYLSNTWGEDKALLMVSTMLDHETTTMTLLYIGRSLEQKRLNAFLAGNSMYGDHGRDLPQDSNVVRLPLYGSEGKSPGLRRSGGTRVGEGEVDAL